MERNDLMRYTILNLLGMPEGNHGYSQDGKCPSWEFKWSPPKYKMKCFRISQLSLCCKPIKHYVNVQKSDVWPLCNSRIFYFSLLSTTSIIFQHGCMFTLMWYINKCTQIKYALSYINIHLHVLGTFVTIINAHIIEHTVSVCFCWFTT